MGIWDDLHSAASRLFNRTTPAKRLSYNNSSFPAQLPTASVVTKVTGAVHVTGAQKSDESIQDPHRCEKIGRILSSLGKFAVDSAVDESLKGVSGGGGGIQVYKVVKDGLKYQSEPNHACVIKKQDLMIAMEEMQAKMEKMQEDVNILKQQNQISVDYSDDFDPIHEKPINISASSDANKKKFFIRSRM